jgi:uncharacterized membrane protein
MSKTRDILQGIGLGAALMYVADPNTGRRRRAVAKDKVVSAWNKTGSAVSTTSRDISNRARGLASQVRSVFTRDEASDEVVTARVRSKMGRAVSNPSAIEVSAHEGRVTLSGPVLADELGDLLWEVYSVKGVRGIDNQLQIHESQEGIPGLQGTPSRPRTGFQRVHWSPATRLLAGTAGGALAIAGLKKRGMAGAVMGALGAGILARGLTNLESRRLFGFGAGRQAVTVKKTININAPVEQVFEFWTNYQNFHRFMPDVLDVRDLGNQRSHWTVAGPGGIPVSWEAETTRYIPNEVLAWKSARGAVVRNSGRIYFTENDKGGTTVDITLSYNPPGGALGHAVAALFGSDPKSEMDQNLLRLKTLIETGRTRVET